MGNSLGCSATGERLVSAARDGDAVEVRMLLSLSPALARYATCRGLNTPLHFAASRAHNEIVTLLLEAGADVNARNYCGQTALMHACRHGHWEVVQTLLLFRCNVTRADYLSGRTALHFAANSGHARCARLVLADFVPSVLLKGTECAQGSNDRGDDAEGSGGSSPAALLARKFDHSARIRFINKPADGGVTALHMAALGGYFDCLQLLLEFGANESAVTLPYGTTANNIGAGSTPLHYAAFGGSLKCCQILLLKGASRLTLNCSGWLPVDIARTWGRPWLEPLLDPNSSSSIPTFPTSKYLSLPLLSILNIAREFVLQLSVVSSADTADTELCSVCLERSCNVAADGCGHELCIRCALYLCSTSNTPAELTMPPGSISCPLCRSGIVSFRKMPGIQEEALQIPSTMRLCNPCISQPRAADSPVVATKPDPQKNRGGGASAETNCPLITCNPFPSSALPTCRCSDDESSCNECEEEEAHGQSSRGSTAELGGIGVLADEQETVETSCTMFWGRRSCQRELQCNAEINAS